MELSGEVSLPGSAGIAPHVKSSMLHRCQYRVSQSLKLAIKPTHSLSYLSIDGDRIDLTHHLILSTLLGPSSRVQGVVNRSKTPDFATTFTLDRNVRIWQSPLVSKAENYPLQSKLFIFKNGRKRKRRGKFCEHRSDIAGIVGKEENRLRGQR
jgi:hypothetical protein